MWQNKSNINENILFYKKLKNIFLFILILMFTLIFKLFFLQILKFTYFENISKNNISYKEIIKANRGIIYDKNGNILVDNKTIYNLTLNQSILSQKEIENLLNVLQNYLMIDKEKILKDIKKQKDNIVLAKNIPKELMMVLKENQPYLKGINIVYDSIRDYKLGLESAHIFGYLNEIKEEELKDYIERGYKLGDIIGRTGIEYQYENILHGEDGYKIFEVDVHGKKKKLIQSIPPKSGKDIFLNIDYNLQKYSESLMKGKKGCIFVAEAKSSKVLAFISSPGYDANQFLYNINEEKLKTFNDKNFPMLNRVIQTRYPPASTFKIIMAYAALNEKIITPDFKITCTGKYQIGNRIAKCWKKGGHGTLNLSQAIENSCDVYFYELGMKLKSETIIKYAKLFGLDKKTGIDLPFEKEGFIPTRKWKKKRFKMNWYDGDTINISIGQGFLIQTPIEIAAMVSKLINYGNFNNFTLLDKIKENNKIIFRNKPNNFYKKNNEYFSKQHVDLIKNAMLNTVSHRTGFNSFVEGLNICGRTGTAQNPHGEDHAWFVSFAPYENPEIIVCVFVENEGGGGKIAAPIAKEIYMKYFELKK
jgi:penicillin-binding protein 2